jgi:sulfate permease, SulP family
MATILAGIILVIMGFARLGDIIKFIPYPVTVGFTAGIAVIIFTSQVKDFLGISGQIPESFYHKWIFYLKNLDHANVPALLTGLSAIAILIFWPKVSKKIPAPLMAILLITAAVKIFSIPAETICDRFGKINCSLHWPSLPKMDLGKIPDLFPSAMTIAVLAGIESLLSAVVADGMTGTRHKSNTELIGQGLANILSPMFGGIPATGAIARTATNIKNGGKTPIAGIVHSITILLIFLFLGRFAELIPLSALSAVLVIVAWNMGEWHLFAKILKSTKSDFFVLMTTFLLTIFVDLTAAIEAGLILASFLFMKSMINVTELGYITRSLGGNEENQTAGPKEVLPKGIEIFEIEGPFFFGAAMKFRDTIEEIGKKPEVLILRMGHVPTIDATGLNALEDVVRKTKKRGTTVILSGIRPGLLKLLRKAEFTGIISEQMIVPNFETAVRKAKEVLEKKEQFQKAMKWLILPGHTAEAKTVKADI